MRLWASLTAPNIPPSARAFSYGRSVGLVSGVLLAAAGVELLVSDLVVELFVPKIAGAVLLIEAVGVVSLANLFLSLFRHPILLFDQHLVVRLGTLLSIQAPLKDLRAVETATGGADTRRRGFLRASALAHPNLILHLRKTLIRRDRWRRFVEIDAIGPCLDDPTALRDALRPWVD